MAQRDVWVVFATPPAGGWVFKTDHFPRLYNYKKDAKAAATEATKLGGTTVEVVKLTKDLAPMLNGGHPSYVSGKLFTHYIVRCEKDGTIFGQEARLDAVDRKDYDPVGDRSISCPRCGRSYYYHNGGEMAEGKMDEWFSDRKLTILHDPSKRHKGEPPDDGQRDRGVRKERQTQQR